MSKTIVVLPGDGIGPEVARAAVEVAAAAAATTNMEVAFREYLFGGVAIDATGVPFPEETRSACARADAILLGAVGGPRWDSGGPRPEAGLLDLRKSLDLFANLRPVSAVRGLEHLSPLRVDRIEGLDLLIVRELTGGLYFGERSEGEAAAYDRCDYSRSEIERVARVAFRAAQGRKRRVVSVDKANVLATSRLWRRTVTELQAQEFPDVELSHILVDAMAMKLVQNPGQFDVVLTENLFGDILSDEASVLPGSIGLAPSASMGDGSPGLFEPIHGSAPDLAGTGDANPVGAILSAAMMFRYSLGAPELAASIEAAVAAVLGQGHATPDLGGSESCATLTARVVAAIGR